MKERKFSKNMFIMLLAIMIGVVIITYFIADIVNQGIIDTLNEEHESEIIEIESNNIRFTNNFLESAVLLDSAREYRAYGNYHFDLASLFYRSALSNNNISEVEFFINQTIENCSMAMPNYLISNLNFENSTYFFNNTKKYTDNENYIHLLNLYVNLSISGGKLTLLRYNASKYLMYLAENITISNGLLLQENVSLLMDLLNETIGAYEEELANYNDLEEEIDEYDIEGFTPIREL